MRVSLGLKQTISRCRLLQNYDRRIKKIRKKKYVESRLRYKITLGKKENQMSLIIYSLYVK